MSNSRINQGDPNSLRIVSPGRAPLPTLSQYEDPFKEAKKLDANKYIPVDAGVYRDPMFPTEAYSQLEYISTKAYEAKIKSEGDHSRALESNSKTAQLSKEESLPSPPKKSHLSNHTLLASHDTLISGYLAGSNVGESASPSKRSHSLVSLSTLTPPLVEALSSEAKSDTVQHNNVSYFHTVDSHETVMLLSSNAKLKKSLERAVGVAEERTKLSLDALKRERILLREMQLIVDNCKATESDRCKNSPLLHDASKIYEAATQRHTESIRRTYTTCLGNLAKLVGNAEASIVADTAKRAVIDAIRDRDEDRDAEFEVLGRLMKAVDSALLSQQLESTRDALIQAITSPSPADSRIEKRGGEETSTPPKNGTNKSESLQQNVQETGKVQNGIVSDTSPLCNKDAPELKLENEPVSRQLYDTTPLNSASGGGSADWYESSAEE